MLLLDAKGGEQFPREAGNGANNNGVRQEYETDFDFVLGFGPSKARLAEGNGRVSDPGHESQEEEGYASVTP